MAEAWAISSFDTYAVLPSRLITTSSGSRLAGMVRVSSAVATSITPSALSWPRATYTVVRSGLSARPRGRWPTVTVATRPSDRAEITLMVLPTSLLAYNRGSLGGVGTAAWRKSGARSAIPPRRASCVIMGTPRSVVEDRLIDVEGPFQPSQVLESADVAQDRPVQIGAAHIRVRQVRARQVGADERNLLEVRAGGIGAGEVRSRGVEPRDAHRLVAGIGPEIRAHELGPLRLGVGHGPDEPCAGEIRVGQVGAREGDLEEAGARRPGVPQIEAM